MNELHEAGTALRSLPVASEHSVVMSDGAELFYRAWLPAGPVKQALLLFHRGHEHSGRWQETVEALGLEDTAVFAWDARGHGRSPGERGSAESFARVIKDVDEFVHHIAETYEISHEDMIVLGHSVGAVAVAAWVHDYAPRLRGMILATPAFRVKLYVPFAIPCAATQGEGAWPRLREKLRDASVLTHDADEARRYQADPLIFRQIAVNILLDLFDTSTRLLQDAGAITVPTTDSQRRLRLGRETLRAGASSSRSCRRH